MASRVSVLAAAVYAVFVNGCGRTDLPPGAVQSSAGAVPTFTRDVAPILFDHCIVCHRPQQAAPFSLLTFDDARSRVNKIARAVSERHMPPWLPEPSAPSFVGERRLSAQQIATIQRWASGGAPRGDVADLPATPTFDDDWQSGPPDMVATTTRPYTLKPGSSDIYRNLVLPLSISAARYIRAVELRAGAAPVHHAVIRVDRTGGSRRRDGVDGEAGFGGMSAQDVQSPDGYFIGWTPGRGAIASPAGLPWRLDRGADLVVELHLLPGKGAIDVRPMVALYFTDEVPARTPVAIKMGTKLIDIPAGRRDFVIEDSYVLPVDVELISLYPHAHYLATEVHVLATMPDGAVRHLLDIDHWDFHWQQDYQFQSPVSMPRGTTLSMRYKYDNSDKNDHNPQKRAVRVTYGTRAIDEMGNLGLQVLTGSLADASVLRAAFAERERMGNVAAAEMLYRIDPTTADHQLFLGSSYADLGRYTEALAPLQQAVRTDPRSASAHNYLGGVLFALGRVNDAIVEFQAAAGNASDDERMAFNLGKALMTARRSDEAARAFARATALNPEFGDAHHNLGAALFSRGRLPDAIVELRRAVDLLPESSEAESDLGGALAEFGRTDEARRHFQRALSLDPGNAGAKQNLALLNRSRR